MGRPLRRHEPGQLYLVTMRCHQARFFLRPDREVNEAVLEWLTRSQQCFPGVRLLAVCVLSNHLHLVVRDEGGELATWASYFFGHLARAVNRIRGRSGTFFERRYSAEPILDDEALLDRLVYVVANPVEAGLCKRVKSWRGVVLFASDSTASVIPVSWVDRSKRRPARRQTRLRANAPKDDSFRVSGNLIIDSLSSISPDWTQEGVRRAIEAQERKIAEDRVLTGRKALTTKQVLGQSWRSAPRRPRRSPRPECHASSPDLRRRFREGFREFVSLFREASEHARAGCTDIVFPEWCYPPGRPLVRPAQASAG